MRKYSPEQIQEALRRAGYGPKTDAEATTTASANRDSISQALEKAAAFSSETRHDAAEQKRLDDIETLKNMYRNGAIS